MPWQPGDIAACYGADLTSRVICLGTMSGVGPAGLRWPPSHVAMVCHHAGRPVWVESTTLCPQACLVNGRQTTGVQAHPPQDRVEDYLSAGGRVDQYRFTDINRLSEAEDRLLSRLLIDHFVRRRIAYDFGGAVLSGTRVFQLLRIFPGANLETLFCSELIAAVLMRLGRMNHANPTRFNPARLLRTLVRTGKYVHCQTFRSDPPVEVSRCCD